MDNTMTAQQFLAQRVKVHEAYIRSAGIRIPKGDYGDLETAEDELYYSAADEGFDIYGIEELDWFKALVVRQAHCNFFE